MNKQSLAIEPILLPTEQAEQKTQENRWVQEEEKLLNERSRWEQRREEEFLQKLLPVLEYRKLVL